MTRPSKPCPDRPDLCMAIAKAKAAFALLTPEQQRDAQWAQRKSWAIGEIMLANPEMTRDEAVALVESVL